MNQGHGGTLDKIKPLSVLLAELNANQLTVGVNDDVVWDLQTIKIGNSISLNVATGEFTLQAGTYELEANFAGITFSNITGGNLVVSWVDSGNSIINKSGARMLPATSTLANSVDSTAKTTLTVTTDTVVKTRCTGANGTCTIVADQSRAIVKKLT